MACSKQPGPRLYISFIEHVFNEKVTQSDWHALRQVVESDSGEKLTRARASREEIESANADLLEAFGDHVGAGVFEDSATREFNELSAELSEKSLNVVNTRGTLEVLRYLAKNGVAETLSSVRGDSEVIYDPQGVEISESSSDGYADRVRDLEDKFGMSTSDAQAAEDAAEYLRKKNLIERTRDAQAAEDAAEYLRKKNLIERRERGWAAAQLTSLDIMNSAKENNLPISEKWNNKFVHDPFLGKGYCEHAWISPDDGGVVVAIRVNFGTKGLSERLYITNERYLKVVEPTDRELKDYGIES